MKLFYTDHYTLPLPASHTFPMSKYRRLRDRVEASGLLEGHQLCDPAAATIDDLLRAHDAEYVDRVTRGELTDAEVRRIGFPWSPGMVERSRRSAGATIAACRAALQDGFAVNLAGGTHHAFRGHGEGYCVFNDSIVAARNLQAAGLARTIVILDCDVHQGNGSALIAADDPTIFTFSIHGAKNFPTRKERSDLDVELPDGTEDAAYLRALADGLAEVFSRVQADLAIYLAGADPYFDDRFGRLALTKEGLCRRDEMVFDGCEKRGLPVAATMAGGYARRVEDVVDLHFQTVREAARRAEKIRLGGS